MPHETELIATIVMGLVMAFAGGFLAIKLRLPPLVGYLLAGVAVGPFTPGFVGDQELANQLAEIGVILLMFGVGLHFSIKRPDGGPPDRHPRRHRPDRGGDGARHRRSRLALGLVASAPASSSASRSRSPARSCCCARWRSAARSIPAHGRIAVGWLIVEDLAMVLALVLLPALAGVLGGDSARARRAGAAAAACG